MGMRRRLYLAWLAITSEETLRAALAVEAASPDREVVRVMRLDTAQAARVRRALERGSRDGAKGRIRSGME